MILPVISLQKEKKFDKSHHYLHKNLGKPKFVVIPHLEKQFASFKIEMFKNVKGLKRVGKHPSCSYTFLAKLFCCSRPFLVL